MSSYWYSNEVEFSDMLGATMAEIEGAKVGSEEMTFRANDGRVWRLAHIQDCCESVELNEVIGDIADLIGSPILRAELVVSRDGEPKPEYPDSWTWSFYKLATIKGEVVLRWLGESNGYYSETVSFWQEQAA